MPKKIVTIQAGKWPFPTNISQSLLPMIKLAVVILNWNRKEETIACIESIYETQEGEFDIIVVDNGSTDDSAESISWRYPRVRVVKSPENRGFSGGMNIGIDTCMNLGYSSILLLNNDTEFMQPGVLKAYDTILENCPEAGAVTARLALNREASVIQRELVADASALKMMLYRIFCPPYPLTFKRNEFVLKGIRCRSVPIFHGVGVGLKTSILKEIGKFNPDFFCYEEDRDLLIRIRKAGYMLLTLSDYSIYHKWSGTADEMSGFKMYFKTRNLWYMRNRYLSKRYSVYAYLRLYGVALKNNLIPYFLSGLKDGLRRKKGNSFTPH